MRQRPQRHTRVAAVVSTLAILVIAAVPASGGIGDTPLPAFSDNMPSVLIVAYPGAVKRMHLQTEFFCTSYETGAIDIGVEIFDGSGSLLNNVNTGAGAVLGVTTGQTVTIATST